MKHFFSGLIVLLWGSWLSACSPAPTDATPRTVRIHWGRDPANLDPLVVSNPSAYEVANLTNCSLLFASDSTLEFVPWLAETFPTATRAGDTLLVTYQLRPEATWDNGQPVLARDVAFTLKVMNCPGLPIEMDQAMFGFVRDIWLDADDPRRFTLVCLGASPDHLRVSGDYSILPEYALDPQHQLRSVPLRSLAKSAENPDVKAFVQRYQALQLAQHPERLPGCGPYRVTEWQTGRFLKLTRKPTWWADALPAAPAQLQAFPQQIIYQIIPDAATATLALRRGDLDVYPMMPANEFDRLQKSPKDRENLRFSTTDSYDLLTATYNTRRSVLRDSTTRQALSLLFNVPALIRATQGGAARPSASLIGPSIKPYYHDSLPLPVFNPTRAADLLRQAGWQRRPEGPWQRRNLTGAPEQLRLRLHYRASESAFETIALQFRAAAAEVGIPVELHPLEQSLLSQQVRAGATDVTLRTINGNPFSYDFTPLLHSRGIGASNASGFSTALSDRLIEDLAAASEPQDRQRLLRKLQLVLYQERPFTVLYFLRYRLAAARRLDHVPVTGIRPGYVASRIR